MRTAERRYRLPAGLLFAISQVESGRPDPTRQRLEPWPWTVQAEGRGLYFESAAQAVQWVKDARARGVTSIDAGCLQVNLFYHPDAFETTEQAFDPVRNADYAARFLLELHAMTGDWGQATGFYHSQTLTLATSYRERVGRALVNTPLGNRHWATRRWATARSATGHRETPPWGTQHWACYGRSRRPRLTGLSAPGGPRSAPRARPRAPPGRRCATWHG